MSQTIMRALITLLAGATLLAAPGCISLLPETEPDALYRLNTGEAPQTRLVDGAQTVIVGRIAAPRGLAGDSIALLREGRIAYMAGAAWLSPGPEMLHAAVLDAMQASAPALTPARAEDGVAARYHLDLELRHFEADYDAGAGAAPLVRVGLRARLIDRDQRSLIAARTLQTSQRADANRQGAIVDAFSGAALEAASALAGWAEAEACRADDAPSACQE